jgi:hypothetical protein
MSAESKDGYIRLLIDKSTGGFSLFFLTDESSMTYEPLFNHRDPSASFLAVNLNGKIYRLGESRSFTTKVETVNGNPAVIYASEFMLIKKIFSPVITTDSPITNGIKITITIENKYVMPVSVGLRMLIDTNLGEGRGKIPFITDNLAITEEKIIDIKSGESYWVSRGANVSVMGSIINPGNESTKEPDFLHFANWKKLNDVPWKAAYYEGKSFNLSPYSIGDSAVCYYYEPDTLERDETFTYIIYLTTEDKAWYMPKIPMKAPVAASANKPEQKTTEEPVKIIVEYNSSGNNFEREADLLTLRKLQDTIKKFISGEIILNEQDLAEIELSIARIKNKYDQL